MDVLSLFFDGGLRAGGAPGPTNDYWYQPVAGTTLSGMEVDEHGAQNLSAWFRGKFILQIVTAMLPFEILQRLPNDGGSKPAVDHPLYDVLHDQTNDVDDSFQYRCEKMAHLIDHGHAYDWIVAGVRGFADQLVPIEPTLVTPKRLRVSLANGAVIRSRELYDIRDPKTGRTNTFTQDEVFHLRAPGGKGILERARGNLGTALATESYAASVFGSGTLNSGTIENPGVMDDEASRRQAVTFVTKPGEWHLPKVLEQGSKWVPDTMTPEDAQMLLSRKHSVDDIARWLGVPRQLLENSDPSFGNAEQFWQSFLTIGMGGWLSLFEFAVNSQLILAPKKYFARFTRQAINRADLTARWTAHVAAVNAGIVSVDEIRAVEDLNKRGGKADELREPQNITGKPTADTPPLDTPPTRRPAAAGTKAVAIVAEAAGRLLRKEIDAVQNAAVKYAADGAAFTAWVATFYRKHAALVSQTLQMTEEEAQAYCTHQAHQLIDAGLAVLEEWRTPAYAAQIAALALAEAA